MPTTKKQPVRKVLTSSLETNLNRRNSDKSIVLCNRGNNMAHFFDIIFYVKRKEKDKISKSEPYIYMVSMC